MKAEKQAPGKEFEDILRISFPFLQLSTIKMAVSDYIKAKEGAKTENEDKKWKEWEKKLPSIRLNAKEENSLKISLEEEGEIMTAKKFVSMFE